MASDVLGRHRFFLPAVRYGESFPFRRSSAPRLLGPHVPKEPACCSSEEHCTPKTEPARQVNVGGQPGSEHKQGTDRQRVGTEGFVLHARILPARLGPVISREPTPRFQFPRRRSPVVAHSKSESSRPDHLPQNPIFRDAEIRRGIEYCPWTIVLSFESRYTLFEMFSMLN